MTQPPAVWIALAVGFVQEEAREEKKKMLEASRIAHEKCTEKLKQRRLDAEKLKATNPTLYAEMYPPNVFHNNSNTI